MKKTAVWLAAAVILYGGLFVSAHLFLNSNPHKVIVIVDTSYEMGKYEKSIHERLLEIFSSRYSVFALYTDKSSVFSWTQSPHLVKNMKFYGPQNFENLLSDSVKNEFEKADKIILITNSRSTEKLTEKYKNIKIVVL